MICMIVKSQGKPLASWLLARDVALDRFLSGKDSQSKDDFDIIDGDLVDVPIVVEWDLNGHVDDITTVDNACCGTSAEGNITHCWCVAYTHPEDVEMPPETESECATGLLHLQAHTVCLS
jgi:hypothetical protein